MARSANTEERQSKKKRRRIAINVPRSKEPIWARALFRPGLSTLCGMLSQKCLSFASRVQIISFVKEGHHDFGILVTTEVWNVFGYLRYFNKACRQIQNMTKNYIFQCNPLKWLRSIQWLLTPHWINLKRWCGGQQIFNGLCTVCCDSRIHFQEAPTIIIIHFSNGNTYPYFVHLTTSDVFSFNAIMRWVIWIKKWYMYNVFIILC